ncbi:MAG: CarD family transcriptional regulator [Anaerovoracaceae bacterium]|jgi:CarD family transcriptional regulator
MFDIGDKIVYPMHGAGIIEKIEEKKILDETREYYIFRVLFGDMKIMIPIDSSSDIGVRPISTKEDLEDTLSVMGQASTEMSDNWNRRYRENMEKLKTGDLQEVAEVVRNLIRVDRVKKLSTGEKKMLSNAKQIFVSEMVLVRGITAEEAEEIIASIV